MKKIRKILSGILSAAMLFAAAAPASAAVNDTGFTDVSAGVWYANAVQYARENGLMSGVGNNAFAPNDTTNLAMLLSTLHRDAGTPAATGAVPAGVTAGSWYADAAAWANAQGLLQNINNDFTGAPLTREDMVTVLWRYAGSPAVTGGETFADNASISSYAAQAVAWSRANNVVAGKPGNLFDPKGGATRAEYAVILQNFMRIGAAAPQPGAQGNTLVVYYSASGTTEGVAEAIAEAANADLFEIVPTEPYTSADLDWTDDSSRVTREHEDESLRTVPLTTTTVANWDSYDTVFIGYPIWWGIAAWPVDGFVKANDFTGKTVIPFCTSASSGLGQSGELLADLAGTGSWQEGRRFSGRASASEIGEWISSLNLPARAAQTAPAAQPAAPTAQASRSLVVYFSMPETTNADNMTREEDNSVVVINGQVMGNTQYMASVIQETAGADLFRIEPKTPYPTDHTTLVDLASEEQDANARPEIAAQIENFDQYDTVYVGYPIWWSDMPMILYTFFDTYDFSGKTIVPFSTHGGSSFAGTPAKIAQLEPNATLLDGLTISRDNIQDARQEIVDWVNGL